MADNVSILEPSAAPTGFALTQSGAKQVGGASGPKLQRIVPTFEATGGAQTDVSTAAPLPVALDALGAKGDALVTDPTVSASPIALLKGLLSGLGSRADAATVDPAAANTTNSFVALLKGLLLGFGTKADAAVTDSTASGSFLGFIKGLLSIVGTKGDGLATSTLSDPQSAMSLLKTIASRAQVPVIAAGENHIGEVGGRTAIAVASIVRPADVAGYTSGDVVAASTTAATVNGAPSELTTAVRKAGGSGRCARARLTSSAPARLGASFRLHLFREAPTLTNGDNGAFQANKATAYIGAYEITLDRAFTDGAKGFGVPVKGPYIAFDTVAGSQKLYPVLETLSDFVPVSGETFTLAFEIDQD